MIDYFLTILSFYDTLLMFWSLKFKLIDVLKISSIIWWSLVDRKSKNVLLDTSFQAIHKQVVLNRSAAEPLGAVKSSKGAAKMGNGCLFTSKF